VIREVKRSWTIPEDNHIQYSSDEVQVIEGEEISFPFKHKSVKSSNLSLIQVSPSIKYLKNCFVNVTFAKNPES